jgi:murein DD-endopeptidase MepM/ murein hydrolase activator NlpD
LARFLDKKVKVLIILILLLIGGVIALFVMSGHSSVAITPAVSTVGLSTPVSVKVENPHGVRRVHAWIEQNGAQSALLDTTEKATRLRWKRDEPARTFTFDAGKDKAPNLKEGKARLVVEAVSNDFRGRTDTTSADVNVVLTAPRVIPDDAQHYINQGGMELVTFNATGSFNESGVKVGKYTFRSFPLPGKGPEQRFSMFAYSWELPPDITPVVYARNLAGTEATGHFWFKLFPKKFRTRDVEADDRLLEKLVTSVDPTGQLAPGPDLVTRFDKINTELRAKNNQQMSDLRFKTEEKILWNGPFTHWGKEEADFADVRNWMHGGKKIDQAVHLGFDLSDVQNGPVNAANDGRVVWADNLGIYGNCVVLDHGYALQSIYGHMRQINVKVGDMVKKGQSMGIAGQTGLAGGVHVHFSMQVDGVQVNPREWWDEHWIRDRILSKLAPDRITPEMAAAPAPVSHARRKRR